MRNLLALLGAAVLTFAGLGWYLGWYNVEAAPGTTPGHQSISVDLDARKIDSDVHKAEREVEDALKREAARGDTAPQAHGTTAPQKDPR